MGLNNNKDAIQRRGRPGWKGGHNGGGSHGSPGLCGGGNGGGGGNHNSGYHQQPHTGPHAVRTPGRHRSSRRSRSSSSSSSSSSSRYKKQEKKLRKKERRLGRLRDLSPGYAAYRNKADKEAQESTLRVQSQALAVALQGSFEKVMGHAVGLPLGAVPPPAGGNPLVPVPMAGGLPPQGALPFPPAPGPLPQPQQLPPPAPGGLPLHLGGAAGAAPDVLSPLQANVLCLEVGRKVNIEDRSVEAVVKAVTKKAADREVPRGFMVSSSAILLQERPSPNRQPPGSAWQLTPSAACREEILRSTIFVSHEFLAYRCQFW